MSAMDRGVTVQLGEVSIKMDPDDVNSEDLKEFFDIQFKVKKLLEIETEKTIHIKKKEKIKPGYTYLIICHNTLNYKGECESKYYWFKQKWLQSCSLN